MVQPDRWAWEVLDSETLPTNSKTLGGLGVASPDVGDVGWANLQKVL